MPSQPTDNSQEDDSLNSPDGLLRRSRSEELRQRAEALLVKTQTNISLMSIESMQKLIYELQVHQIELEMQNEALNDAYHELNASRERFTQLFNNGPLGYLTLNTEGIIQQANIAAARLMDSSVEQLTGKKLAEFVYPDDQDSYYFFIQDISSLHPDYALTFRLKTPKIPASALSCPGIRLTHCSQESCSQSNRFTYLECRYAIQYLQSNQHHICFSINDISDRKLAQESIVCLNEKLEEKIGKQTQALFESNLSLRHKIDELAQSKQQIAEREEKLNAIFNATVEGILTFDELGHIISANSAVETIFGYRPDELIDENISKVIPALKRQHEGVFIKNEISSRIDNVRSLDGKHKNGSIVPLDISEVEYTIAGIRYYATIIRDISLRKLKEREDKAHFDDLAHVTRLGLMGEMASGIAHEVNQPLAAICSYTQACINFMKVEPPDLLTLREILEKTNQQALRAGEIIHRMREFVTHKTIHRSSVRINELVMVSLSLLACDLKRENIIQKLNLDPKLPTLYVDNVQIEQVLINLIKNSLDALKLLKENKSRQISIETLVVNHQSIVIRIKDNGPGIALQDEMKIFKPFFTTKNSGMGMGLSISQSILKAHNGTLTFHSKVGKGTTFYITLPLKEQNDEKKSA